MGGWGCVRQGAAGFKGAFLFHGEWGAGAGGGHVNGDPTLERIAQGNGLALCAAGPWIARFAPLLDRNVADAEKLTGSRPNIFLDVSGLKTQHVWGLPNPAVSPQASPPPTEPNQRSALPD